MKRSNATAVDCLSFVICHLSLAVCRQHVTVVCRGVTCRDVTCRVVRERRKNQRRIGTNQEPASQQSTAPEQEEESRARNQSMAGTFINHSTTVAVTQSNKMNEEKKMGEHFLIPTKIQRATHIDFAIGGERENKEPQTHNRIHSWSFLRFTEPF